MVGSWLRMVQIVGDDSFDFVGILHMMEQEEVVPIVDIEGSKLTDVAADAVVVDKQKVVADSIDVD